MDKKKDMNIIYFRIFDSRDLSSFDYGFRKFGNCFSLLSSGIYRLKLWSKFRMQQTILNEIKTMDVIKDDDFVLCPLYGDKYKITDFQLGATETRKEGENELSCFKRCLGEELGLRYNYDYLPMNSIELENIQICCSNINNLTPIKEKNETISTEIDTKTLKKIASIVYGNKTDILNFLNKDDLVTDEDTDKIVGIVAIQYKEIKKFFK